MEDVASLNASLRSLHDHLAPTLKDADLIIFCEESFREFQNFVEAPWIGHPVIRYEIVDLHVPESTEERILNQIPEYFPHPTHGNGPIAYGHPGFTIGYRSMCRFFSGTLFAHPSLLEYEYFMRMDTDSFFLKGTSSSLFKWAKDNEVDYGYIKSAIQQDHPAVTKGFKRTCVAYFRKISFLTQLKALTSRRNRIYYTNFEIGRLSFFRSKKWIMFFDHLDATGGFYLNRWGDAIVRYLGVNVLLPRKNRKPIPRGFVYKHGGTFYS